MTGFPSAEGKMATVVVFDEDAMGQVTGLNKHELRAIGGERRLLELLATIPGARQEKRIAGGLRGGAGASFLIETLRVHLSLTKVKQDVVKRALKALAGVLLLHSVAAIPASKILLGDTLVKLLETFTLLTHKQLDAVNAILELKRFNPVQGVWPTTASVADRLSWTEADVRSELTPLVNRVVRFDAVYDMWAVEP